MAQKAKNKKSYSIVSVGSTGGSWPAVAVRVQNFISSGKYNVKYFSRHQEITNTRNREFARGLFQCRKYSCDQIRESRLAQQSCHKKKKQDVNTSFTVSFTVSADPKKPFWPELPQHSPVKQKNTRKEEQRGFERQRRNLANCRGALVSPAEIRGRPTLMGRCITPRLSLSLSLWAPVVTKARRVLNRQWTPPYFNALPCWDLAPALGTEMVLLLRVTSNCRCGDWGLNIQVLCVCVFFGFFWAVFQLNICYCNVAAKEGVKIQLWSNRFYWE